MSLLINSRERHHKSIVGYCGCACMCVFLDWDFHAASKWFSATAQCIYICGKSLDCSTLSIFRHHQLLTIRKIFFWDITHYQAKKKRTVSCPCTKYYKLNKLNVDFPIVLFSGVIWCLNTSQCSKKSCFIVSSIQNELPYKILRGTTSWNILEKGS